MLLSPPAVDWVPLDPAAPEPVKVGDLVSADAGGLPIYRVMALEEGRAWVATRPGAPERMMPLEGMRWRGVERWGLLGAGHSFGAGFGAS